MSTGVPRWVIVDDIDSRIQYSGPWFEDKGSQDSVGPSGPAFRSTLHGTQANASLEFAYHGSRVQIFGTIDVQNVSGVVDPTWECYLDGILLSAVPFFPQQNNNWLFCEQEAASDGPHIITVNATVMRNQPFWFDAIRYVPSATVPLDQESIFVDHADPQLQYGQGWQDGMTNTTGSIFTFDFIGVSISSYGFLTLPGTPSSVTYSIDGTLIQFTLKGMDPRGTNEKFFETATLPAGPHILQVVYRGNNSTPLWLDYLIVQNGTLPSTATSVSSSTTTDNGVSGTSTPGKSSTPVGVIVGSVIGGLTLIVFAALGLLLLRRHKRRAAEEKVLSSTPRPFDFEHTTLHPSSTTPNYSLPLQPSLTIRKPLLPPQPAPRPSPLPLFSRAEGNAEALAASESQRQDNTLPAMVSMQSNDTRSSNFVAHVDSGIRMPASTRATSIITEAPPLYTIE